MDQQGPHYSRIDRARSAADERPLVSIVVPLYNESAVVEEFYARTSRVLDGLDVRWEIVAVNDGSSDETLDRLARLHWADERVKIIDLSRNFGKEVALTAGLDHAGGDAVIPIDADLQDPPEVIPQLVEKWRQGYEVVYATRLERLGESWLRCWTAGLFYRMMRGVVRVDIPRDTGDFRLLSRSVVEALRRFPEKHRFMKGLFSWVGFRQAQVTYRREPRLAGSTKWSYWKLCKLALEGITSFSNVPLRIATYLGLLATVSAVGLGGWVVLGTLVGGRPAGPFPLLVALMLFLGGGQLLSTGILGEYVGRVYDESKHRPLYLVRRSFGLAEDAPAFVPPVDARGSKSGKVGV